VLFIVQSPYWFTIGHRGVFSLGRWSAQLRTEFHELRATLVRLSKSIGQCRIRGYHPLWPAFPDRSAIGFSTQGARNPRPKPGLGYSAFARRYSRNRCLFIFLRVLRCFCLFSATPLGSRSKSLHLARAHLLPKLRCHFAEFLKQGSLTRLRILSSPTCVGLRYGHLENSLEAFLGSLGSTSLRDCSLHITSWR